MQEQIKIFINNNYVDAIISFDYDYIKIFNNNLNITREISSLTNCIIHQNCIVLFFNNEQIIIYTQDLQKLKNNIDYVKTQNNIKKQNNKTKFIIYGVIVTLIGLATIFTTNSDDTNIINSENEIIKENNFIENKNEDNESLDNNKEETNYLNNEQIVENTENIENNESIKDNGTIDNDELVENINEYEFIEFKQGDNIDCDWCVQINESEYKLVPGTYKIEFIQVSNGAKGGNLYIETTTSWCDKYGNPTTQDPSTLEDGWVYDIVSSTGNQFNGFTTEIEIQEDNLIFLTINLGLKITKL